MKKFLFLSMLLAFIVSFSGCTKNEMVKNYGGTATINLPEDTKLVNCTWKETNMWTLTRPMTASDSAITYEFHENSAYGIVEGTYIIKERKSEKLAKLSQRDSILPVKPYMSAKVDGSITNELQTLQRTETKIQ